MFVQYFAVFLLSLDPEKGNLSENHGKRGRRISAETVWHLLKLKQSDWVYLVLYKCQRFHLETSVMHNWNPSFEFTDWTAATLSRLMAMKKKDRLYIHKHNLVYYTSAN